MRSVVLVVAGAIIGAVGVGRLQPEIRTLIDSRPGAPVAPTDDVSSVATLDANESLAGVDAGSLAAARIATWERASKAVDALDLESLLDVAAAEPRSRSRDLKVRALLARLAELDPERAVDYAESAFLETAFLIQAFEALARSDAERATARVAAIGSAAARRRVALALLDALGADESAVERIVAALPEWDRASFEADALIARAELDPLGVLNEALGGGMPGMQSYLLPRLAEVAVGHDPLGALALAEGITDFSLALSYEFAILSAWTDLDPDAVLAWLEQAPPSAFTAAAPAFRTLARNDPERLLAAADAFPPSARDAARRAAMQALADRDPISALAFLDGMPPGQDRESLLQAIGQSYGRKDPETAIAWARSLSPPSETAVQSVLQGIARVDIDRAIDLFIADVAEQAPVSPTSPPSFNTSFGFTIMLTTLSANGVDVARLTDKLLETNDPRIRSMLSSTLMVWASRDATAALDWTLANAAQLDSNALRNVARNLAETNLDLAVSTLDRLPTAQRAGWMDGVAALMAQSDPAQARSFVDRYRGQPGYDAAIGSVAQEMARSDPAGAARLLAEVESQAAWQRGSFIVAREWANRDPAAAARWVLEDIADPQVQTTSLRTIASTWAQRDASAAERWIFSLGSGPMRDAAADGFMAAAAQVGRFEPRLLEAYSSDQASQLGVSRAIVTMARSDPARAEELMDTYLTDPAVRAQTEEQIARISALSSGSLSPAVSIAF